MKNLFSVEGKVAVVTGGSRGIGEMIARRLVEAGAKVYISSRKAEVCEAVAKELSASGTAIAIVAAHPARRGPHVGLASKDSLRLPTPPTAAPVAARGEGRKRWAS